MTALAMQGLRTWRPAHALSAVALTSFFLLTSGCTERPSRQVYDRLNAQQIYQGLFFGIGPAAALLPEVYDTPFSHSQVTSNPEQAVAYLHAIAEQLRARGDSAGAALVNNVGTELRASGGTLPTHGNLSQTSQQNLRTHELIAALFTAQIERQNPGFFRGFETGMRSGNPVHVSAAMEAAGEETFQASKTLLLHYEEIDPATRALCAFKALVLVAAGAVALVVVVWSGVFLIEGVWVYTTQRFEGPRNPLHYDQLVARITAALARSGPALL